MSVYIAIDLKSFYASVECRERGLDPLATNLVVADETRTEKTICLAVSPSLKQYGIPGRARLFEVVEKVRAINAGRMRVAGGKYSGSSFYAGELERDKTLALDYIVAPPRMAKYMEYSRRVYGVYLRYVEQAHIHPYSVDEVFIDATEEIASSGMTPREFTMTLIRAVLNETGITATAGIAPNLFLCKVAMDIVAKHIGADENGVRIAETDEESFRRDLWGHVPITDFWRVGRGTAKKLEKYGMHTMGDVARCSVQDEELLFRLFGVNAELLIDHAWGIEPCGIADIKAYKPRDNSLSNGQVLSMPYSAEKARLIAREMAEALSLDLVAKDLVTDRITLAVGYEVPDAETEARLGDRLEKDFYGRTVPRPAHGGASLDGYTSSTRAIARAALEVYDRIIDRTLLVRRILIAAGRVIPEKDIVREPMQLDMFTDMEETEREEARRDEERRKEKSVQLTLIGLRRKYGANAVFKGMDLSEGATARERNRQIGGHKA